MSDRQAQSDRNGRTEPQSPADVPLDTLPVVTLSERWQKIAHHLGCARALTYRDYDGREQYGGQSLREIHKTGVFGEIAAQQSAGEPVQDAIHVLGDPGYDLVVGEERVDVKTTAADVTLPSLLVPVDQSIDCDIYLLCHKLDAESVRIVGWSTPAEVVDRTPERFPASQKNYVVPPRELHLP